METYGSGNRISAREAAESLAAVRDSQRRARRIGYPAWFWLASGPGLAAVPLYTAPRDTAAGAWLPHPWATVLSVASLVLLAVVVVTVYVRELPGSRHCLQASRRELARFAWPVLSYVVVVLAGGIAWDNALWSAPVAPVATAVAAFACWSGLGLACTTFSVFPARS